MSVQYCRKYFIIVIVVKKYQNKTDIITKKNQNLLYFLSAENPQNWNKKKIMKLPWWLLSL